MFTQEQVQYFEFLIRNAQIFSFKQPRRAQIGQLIGFEQRITIIQKIKQLDYMDQVDIKNIISDVAKLAIRDHLDVI